MANITCSIHPAFKVGPDGLCPVCRNRGTTPSPAPAVQQADAICPCSKPKQTHPLSYHEDLICGVCGRNVTNDPGTLCAGCGMSLTRAYRRGAVTANVEVSLEDPQSVSLTNPAGATVAPKVYPESVVMDLLERAYMEGAWVGGKGHANTPRTVEAFNRWITRLRERGEL